MNNFDFPLRHDSPNLAHSAQVEPSSARHNLYGDSGFSQAIRNLEIWVLRVLKHPHSHGFANFLQALRQVEKHVLCAIVPAATDEFQNPHDLPLRPALDLSLPLSSQGHLV